MERPGEVLRVIIDGVDQTKLGIPRFTEKSKSESGFLRRQKPTGVLFHSGLGRDDFLAYSTSPDNLHGGANQTIGAFARCFLILFKRRSFKPNLCRPTKLYIQLDILQRTTKIGSFCVSASGSCVMESLNVYMLASFLWAKHMKMWIESFQDYLWLSPVESPLQFKTFTERYETALLVLPNHTLRALVYTITFLMLCSAKHVF